MAQVALAPVPVGTDGMPLTVEDLREILEYEKIVQFRDAVLAGTHPRVKIPSHLLGKQLTTTRNTSSPSLSTPRANAQSQSTRSTSGPYFENSSPFHNNRSPSNYRASLGGHVPMTSKSEINPILLEKSDDLIKAEIQLQRQRLERALREQIEQQRLSAKALLQTSESLPNFDLSEVLSKALEIVHPSTSAEIDAPVDTSASDSFDEKTFYSSQHDTPEPFSSPQSQKNSVEARSHGLVSVDKQPTESYTSKSEVEDQDMALSGASIPNDNYSAAQTQPQVQQARPQQHTQEMDAKRQPSHIGNAGSSGFHAANVQSASGMNTKSNEKDNITRTTSQFFQREFEDETDSPLIRAHNLSPLAPQPARVSPLATARNPPILRDENLADEPPPAQVAALRQKASGFSSTDSSPRGVKESGKKKGRKEKKKKRKASSNGNAADTPDSPYIKPEPRSPSPFAVAPLPRPQKRQRQMGQFAAELNYDEPRYEPTENVQQRVLEGYQEAQAPRTYSHLGRRYEVETRRPEPTYQRVEREEGDYRRVSGGYYAKRPESPVYALPYAASETRPVRAASHAVVDRKGYDEPFYYREPILRASARPDADRERSRSPIMRERRSSPIAMGPPRRPVRIIVDEYGREYIDPTPVPSMPPPARYRESEIVYERAPPRSVSGRVPVDAYEEDGIVYRRPSPPIVVPRRVVTQPEYTPSEYRSYRQREYSTRPMALPGEDYLQIRAPERRPVSHIDEAQHEYASRAQSVRPEPARYEEISREHVRPPSVRPEPMRYEEVPREYVRATTVRPEPVRYEIPREYRLQSVRPEPPLREYAASVRPEARREMIPQREFSIRPVEQHERYHDEVPGPNRVPAEVAFIERPRAREASVMVYADDRREVYR